MPPRLRVAPRIEPVYANMVRIAHTPSELMFDFARILPGDQAASIVSRVLMSPLGAKLLLNALSENLAKYESAHGEIKIPQKQSLADFLFRPLGETGEDQEPPEKKDE
jgi:hypothetical protein